MTKEIHKKPVKKIKKKPHKSKKKIDIKEDKEPYYLGWNDIYQDRYIK